MACKCTYMYRVTMGYGSNPKKTAYCYARNAAAAKQGMREIFAEYKYDKYETVMFGEADIKKHPERFMPMPKDEVDYIIRTELAKAEAYAQQKPLPISLEFVPEASQT